MDNYRVLNRELIQKNQELKQTVWVLAKEKNATQSYSGILQGVYADYHNLLKRTTNSWTTNGLDNCKKRSSSSYALRDSTNLPKKRTHEHTWLTGNTNESMPDKSSQNDDQNEATPTIQVEMESMKPSKISEFVNTKRKKYVSLQSFSEDIEMETRLEESSANGVISHEEPKLEEIPCDTAGGLHTITEESTIRGEVTISLITSQDDDIVDIHSIPEDTVPPDDFTTNTTLNISASLAKTLYTSSAMQLTDVKEDDSDIEDFPLSKISSSTPYKGHKTIKLYPKVVLKRLSKSVISDSSTRKEARKSISPKKPPKKKGRKRPQKTNPNNSPTTHSPLPSTSNDRPRRRAAPVSLAEPKLNTKMRNYDAHSS